MLAKSSLSESYVVQTEISSSAWRNPAAWVREKKLSQGFWIFFTAAFFFDFGFSVYSFLFNLFLLDFHFNERAIGLVGSASLLGSVVGTLPAGLLARKYGVRPLLILCFIAAPILGAIRTLVIWEPAQIALGFFFGLAMCLWGVCFLPSVARLTTEENRASGFSLIISISIGSAMLGGIICGYLPRWLASAGFVIQPAALKRLILLASCGIAMLGLFAVLKMTIPRVLADPQEDAIRSKQSKRWWKIDPFMFRFLPAMALWTSVLAAFTPFANIYLSRDLHVPLTQIGLIFSTTQVLQFCVGMLTPIVFRILGLVNGVVATQVMTAIALGLLATTHNTNFAITMYITFSAVQWMSAPGLHNLLMSKVPDDERSTSAAIYMFCSSLVQSATVAIAGILFVNFGYPHVLSGIALVAVMAGLLFKVLIGSNAQPESMGT
jgi:MFS family permease